MNHIRIISNDQTDYININLHSLYMNQNLLKIKILPKYINQSTQLISSTQQNQSKKQINKIYFKTNNKNNADLCFYLKQSKDNKRKIQKIKKLKNKYKF
ncbi:hypothetical protein ABPG72_003689 [Tetrahymena utriculariae]